MILCWFGGDIFKAAYYARIDAPIQLILCAGLQISLDVLILWQFWLYKNNRAGSDNIETQRLQKGKELAAVTQGSDNNVNANPLSGHEEPLHVMSGE